MVGGFYNNDKSLNTIMNFKIEIPKGIITGLNIELHEVQLRSSL